MTFSFTDVLSLGIDIATVTFILSLVVSFFAALIVAWFKL